eukprot:11048296-Alexandrium_andersonii.AAC.1
MAAAECIFGEDVLLSCTVSGLGCSVRLCCVICAGRLEWRSGSFAQSIRAFCRMRDLRPVVST